MTARRPAPPEPILRCEAGFTLVEIVAALALTGLVLLTVAGAYFTLHRTLNALTAADGQARQRAVYRRLRADLETAYTSANPALPPFAGEADRLSFAARLGPTGVSRVEYLPGGEGLERRVTPWVPEGEEGPGEAAGSAPNRPGAWSTPLVEPGREVRFRYLSRSGGWSTRWSGEVEGGLPVAVEVAVANAGPGPAAGPEGAGRQWVFPLHAGSPPGEEP
jgi:type II secretory pathway pseudopilin PulG